MLERVSLHGLYRVSFGFRVLGRVKGYRLWAIGFVKLSFWFRVWGLGSFQYTPAIMHP